MFLKGNPGIGAWNLFSYFLGGVMLKIYIRNDFVPKIFVRLERKRYLCINEDLRLQ